MTFEPCIVIPIYNHGETIGNTVAALSPYQLRCFIVDDGSDEPTRRALERLVRQNSWLTIERIERNAGKGAAVMRGFELASRGGYSHVLQLDADEQHDAGDVPMLLETAGKNPEALVAAQPVFDASLPSVRRWSRRLTHFWVAIETLSLRPPDTMCGFRVYPLTSTSKVLAEARVGRRMDFDIEIMVRLLWAGVPLLTLPTRVNYPPDGKSNFRYVRDNVLISWMHTRLVFGSLKQLPRRLRRSIAAPEGSRQHWSNTKERGAVLGIRLLVWTYRLLGKRVYRLILVPVMLYFFVTGRAARNASRTFLQRAYEAGSSHSALQEPPTVGTSFRHFLAFGDSAIDTMAAWMGDLTDSDLVFENQEEFFRVAHSGSGAVIISAHLGNMNLCRGLAGPDAAAYLTVLMFTEHAANFNKVLKQLNPKVSEGVIFLDRVGPDTAIKLQRKIESGRMIVLLGDRMPASARAHVNRVQFLGHPAPLPQGPFIVAGLLGCPVYLMFCIKAHKKYHVYWEPFETLVDLSRTARAENLRKCVESYAKRLEYYALKEPLQWFNFYDFWREGNR